MRNRLLSLVCFFGVVVPAQASEENWILITTPELREAFEPLVELRRKDGYDVSVVDDWRADSRSASESVVDLLARITRFRDAADRTFVLIGGAYDASNPHALVPPCVGRNGRMQGKPTDYYYSLPDEQGHPTVAVGRLPASSLEEASAIVHKVIKCSEEKLPESAPHLGIIVAHPGGETKLEQRFGEAFLQLTVADRLKLFDPRIRVKVIADIENSDFAKPNQDFQKLTRDMLSAGNLFTVYSGHSSAQGLWSTSGYVATRNEFSKIDIQGYPGVFLSCGCFTCQVGTEAGAKVRIQESDGTSRVFTVANNGFGISAIRNANGPAAVVGPYGESYAIFGKLAFDALQEQFQSHDSATRLGNYWLAVQRNLLSGKANALTFYMFDQADGSRGKTSFADQRKEHVEMWTLLGDPATALAEIPNGNASASRDAGKSQKHAGSREASR